MLYSWLTSHPLPHSRHLQCLPAPGKIRVPIIRPPGKGCVCVSVGVCVGGGGGCRGGVWDNLSYPQKF